MWTFSKLPMGRSLRFQELLLLRQWAGDMLPCGIPKMLMTLTRLQYLKSYLR